MSLFSGLLWSGIGRGLLSSHRGFIAGIKMQVPSPSTNNFSVGNYATHHPNLQRFIRNLLRKTIALSNVHRKLFRQGIALINVPGKAIETNSNSTDQCMYSTSIQKAIEPNNYFNQGTVQQSSRVITDPYGISKFVYESMSPHRPSNTKSIHLGTTRWISTTFEATLVESEQLELLKSPVAD